MSKIKELRIDVGVKPSRDFSSWHMDMGMTIELTDEESERWSEIYTEKLTELEDQLKQEHSAWCQKGLW